MHIFSEGKEADFVDMRTLAGGVRPFFHLNYDLMSSFHHMVSADGFILAPSMMSFAVGMLRPTNNFRSCCVGRPACRSREEEEEREFVNPEGTIVSIGWASAQRAEEEAWEESHFGGPES